MTQEVKQGCIALFGNTWGGEMAFATRNKDGQPIDNTLDGDWVQVSEEVNVLWKYRRTEDVLADKIKQIDAKITRTQADAAKKVMELMEERSKLLCLPSSVEVDPLRSVREEDIPW